MHWDGWGWTNRHYRVSVLCHLVRIQTRNRPRHDASVPLGLKPSIQGPNQASVLNAIDDTLEWLQPPKKRQDEARKSA